MPLALSIIVPLTLAVVLGSSGVGKLRTPDDLAGWRALRVPTVLTRAWLVRVHPLVEIGLGVGLLVLGGGPGAVVAFAALVLMLAYTWLVWRTLRSGRQAQCACFGARATVTRRTLARNSWLAMVAILAVPAAWSQPILGGVVAGLASGGVEPLSGVAAAVLTAVTALLVAASSQGSDAPAPGLSEGGETSAAAAAELGDYLRERTPAILVTQADRSRLSLRELSRSRAVLLLCVSERCSGCSEVIAHAPQWRSRLEALEIRVLTQTAPELSRLTSLTSPQTLHDPDDDVGHALGLLGRPAAVLLGADGMLAGGPVAGFTAIEDLVRQIQDQLGASNPS